MYTIICQMQTVKCQMASVNAVQQMFLALCVPVLIRAVPQGGCQGHVNGMAKVVNMIKPPNMEILPTDGWHAGGCFRTKCEATKVR